MEFKNEFKQCGCKRNEPCTCGKHENACSIGEMPRKHMFHHAPIKHDFEKENCPDRVKGFNLCRRRTELRCFQHCEPISQPCPSDYFPYFTNRTNNTFSGLVVVRNNGSCLMQVQVTDRSGLAELSVNPGASVPIFVEGLRTLQIRCLAVSPAPTIATCDGEIIFDLEYCASTICF